MIDLKALKLLDILPSSISGDLQVKSMAAALDPELQSVSFDTREALIISRIDELPENVLDLLAWQWHVDFYEPERLPVAMKRSLIKNSILWHRKKGTLWAVKRILRDLGLEPTVYEWFEINGAKPYTFAIEAEDRGGAVNPHCFLGEDTDKLLRLAVEATKPVRSEPLYIVLIPTPPDIALEHGYGLCFYGECFHSGGWWPLSVPCPAGRATLGDPRVAGAGGDARLSFIAYHLAPVYGVSHYGDVYVSRPRGVALDEYTGLTDRRLARYRGWLGPWTRLKWSDRERYWDRAPRCKAWSFSFARGVYGDKEPMGSINSVYSPGYWVYPPPPLYGSAVYGDRYPAPYRVPIDRYYDDRFTNFAPVNIRSHGFGFTLLSSHRAFYEDDGWRGPWGGRWGFGEFPSPNLDAEGFYARLVYESKGWGGSWEGPWTVGDIPVSDGGADESVSCLFYENGDWSGPWEGPWAVGEIPFSGGGMDESISCFTYEGKAGDIPVSGYGMDESASRLAYAGDTFVSDGGADESMSCLIYESKGWGGSWEGPWTVGEIPVSGGGADESVSCLFYENGDWSGPWEGPWAVGEIPFSDGGMDESISCFTYEGKAGDIPISEGGMDESASRLAYAGDTFVSEGGADESVSCLFYENGDWSGPWEGPWAVGEIPFSGGGGDMTMERTRRDNAAWEGVWAGMWAVSRAGEIIITD
jgi:phage tail P2-like protein